MLSFEYNNLIFIYGIIEDIIDKNEEFMYYIKIENILYKIKPSELDIPKDRIFLNLGYKMIIIGKIVEKNENTICIIPECKKIITENV